MRGGWLLALTLLVLIGLPVAWVLYRAACCWQLGP